MNENRSFSLMRQSALKRLEGRDPADIAAKTGIPFFPGENAFRFDGVVGEIRVSFPDYTVTPALDLWYELVLLHYLDIADGRGVGENAVSLSTLKDGAIRGADFDARCDRKLARIFAGVDETRAAAACEALGAVFRGDRADLFAVFPLFPRCPAALRLWFEDDELPASGRILFFDGAEGYLTMEDNVTIGEWLLQLLEEALKQV
ncbi:MAG: DUF3786 domain-containing protein [Bacillota bacterium]|jgi:hypothetical protein